MSELLSVLERNRFLEEIMLGNLVNCSIITTGPTMISQHITLHTRLFTSSPPIPGSPIGLPHLFPLFSHARGIVFVFHSCYPRSTPNGRIYFEGVIMDIGTAFLLGVLVGQWVFLFVIWRVLIKLVSLISNAGTNSSPPTSRDIIDYKPPHDGYHFKY